MFGAPSRFSGPLAGGIGAHYRDLDVQARVEGASPHGLVQILYDELLKALDALRAAEHAGTRLPTVHSRALSILAGLETGLDTQRGGEVSRTLRAIYREARRLLGTAYGPARAAALDQARAMMAEIAAAWGAIAVPGRVAA